MKIKKKKRVNFWKNIRFKYKLTIINENTLEEVLGIHVSKLNGFSVILSVLLLILLIASLIIAFTPLRNYLPGYMNSEVRNQIVTNALRVDSLQELAEKQNLYIMNIQDVLGGKIKTDPVQTKDSVRPVQQDSLMIPTEREMKFREKYEEEEKYRLAEPKAGGNREGIIFYPPVKGLETGRFNPAERKYYVAVLPNRDEPIVAALDGTVIYSGLTADREYVIGIQHTKDFVSVYKNCGMPLKEVGDVVKGGEAIAQTAKENGKKYKEVHFELWKKGKAVNPNLYIAF